MSEKVKQDHVGLRLMSYSAAAGLGAIAVGQQAEAEIILLEDIPVVLPANPTVNYYKINLDQAGTPELDITTSATQMRVFGLYGTEILTTGGYYINSFDAGAEIGPSSTVETGANIAVGNYNTIGTGKYVGFKWNIGGGDYRYGYIEIDAVGKASTAPIEVTLYSVAYETTPNTAIIAGAQPVVPEPGSFALLAAGAGALAFRRRKAA